MKKIYFCILISAFMMYMPACKKSDDFLDKTVVTNLSEATTFADSANTMNFLVAIYSDIGFSARFDRLDNKRAGLNVACDEADGLNIGATQWHIQFASGTINALAILDDAWVTTYANLRRINILLKNLPVTPLSPELKSRVEGEARFLRAWYYSILMKHYGGIPIIKDTLFSITDNIAGHRNTYEECVNYVTSECDAAAALLPTEYIGLDYGRATKGACLALKARVLLYAASPLFNGGGIATEPEQKAVAGYPAYDKERWLKAANAAKDVMDQGTYHLYVDNVTAPGYGFQKVFTMRVNPEYILAEMRPPNKDLEKIWDPPSRGALGSVYPYQELVDAFEMKNGKAINEAGSGYDLNNPYVGREPRFAYTILFNEGLRLDKTTRKKEKVYTYKDAAQDGIRPTGSITHTGYYVVKMLDENSIQASTSPNTDRCLPLIRYAEVLLSRAEALNEYTGPTGEVYNLIGEIRQRAGFDPYELPAGLTQDQMRLRIQNERRIELAFEEHRFWDVRRWKIAEQTDNRMLHGMEITRISDGVYTYKQVDVRRHAFSRPMYLWPIPQAEISKSFDIIQNPGW